MSKTPLGMASDQWKHVKETTFTVNGIEINDLGYFDILKQGIKSGVSSLSHAWQDDNIVDRFVKDDAPFASNATAAWNVVYGALVNVWTNMEVPTYAALAKQPWTKSGIRVKTADSSTLVSGMGETDALPASTNPTYALMKFGLKQMVTRADWTSKMQRLSASGDDCIPTPDQLLKDKTEEHIKGLTTLGILVNAETAAAAATANNTGTELFESLDRIISCNAEENDLGGTHTGLYNPWADIATIDRDSGTTYDSVVVHGDGTMCYQTGNPDFTTDATLTLDAKDTLLEQCLTNGLKKENAMWMTGWDTYFRLKKLYDVKERIMNPVEVSYSVNGVSTQTGADVGFSIASMDDIPLIVDPNCPSDTISKLYLIDRSNVYLQLATPTVNIDLGYPAFSTITSLAQRLGYAKILLTEGELCASRLNTSGKLCALKQEEHFLAFSYTINKQDIFGTTRVVMGEFASTDATTGGDIVTGLNTVYHVDLTHTGNAAVESAPSVDETMPCGGTVTIKTVTATAGTFIAYGEQLCQFQVLIGDAT